MTRSWAHAIGAALLAGALLCACARGGGDEHRGAAEAPRALKNPSDFPLYPRSEVVRVMPVDTAPMFAVMRANNPSSHLPDNYRGHVIIAETGATAAQLRSWVRALEAAPPPGFHDATRHHVRTSPAVRVKSSSDENTFDVNGDGTAQFESAGSSRWVYVITADPKRVYEQGRPLFAMIDGYTAAPSFLRAPLDDEMKKATGYSVTQMLDANSPAGAVIAEIKRLQSTDRRAILLIDEAKTK